MNEMIIMNDPPILIKMHELMVKYREELLQLERLEEGYRVITKIDDFYYELCLSKRKIDD